MIMRRTKFIYGLLGLMALFAIASCSSDDVKLSKLDGKWHVVDDTPDLASDGSITYNFTGGIACIVTVYDALSNQTYTHDLQYVVSRSNDILTIYDKDVSIKEDVPFAGQYKIKKLNNKHMNLASLDERNENVQLKRD